MEEDTKTCSLKRPLESPVEETPLLKKPCLDESSLASEKDCTGVNVQPKLSDNPQQEKTSALPFVDSSADQSEPVKDLGAVSSSDQSGNIVLDSKDVNETEQTIVDSIGIPSEQQTLYGLPVDEINSDQSSKLISSEDKLTDEEKEKKILSASNNEKIERNENLRAGDSAAIMESSSTCDLQEHNVDKTFLMETESDVAIVQEPKESNQEMSITESEQHEKNANTPLLVVETSTVANPVTSNSIPEAGRIINPAQTTQEKNLKNMQDLKMTEEKAEEHKVVNISEQVHTPDAEKFVDDRVVIEKIKDMALPKAATQTPEPMEIDNQSATVNEDNATTASEIEGRKLENSKLLVDEIEANSQNDGVSNLSGLITPTDTKDSTQTDTKNPALDLRASLLASRVGELCANNDSQSNTLGGSSENSTGFSTPIGSYQDSAAPSPKHFEVISKEAMLNFASSGQSTPITSKRPNNKKKKGKSKRVSKPVVVDEETRMDATTVSSVPELQNDNEDSQSSTGTSSKKEVRRFRCEVIVPESTEDFTVEKVVEYIWPLEGMGEHYFIQEHMSHYLGIMSFKRKYPDLRRRPIESQEKEYLRDQKIVSEMACDLGLTAVRSEDVLDVMFNDFPHKYEELTKALRDRKEKKIKEESRLEYQVMDLDKSRMHEYSKKAAKGAAKWNAMFNRERQEERRYAFDMQTFTLHYQQSRCKKLPAEMTKKGAYPVTVLPGQYSDYYKEYNAVELRAMPLNTVLYGPFTAEELEEDPLESEDDSVSACTPLDEKEVVADPVETSVPTSFDPLSAEKLPRCKVCNGGRDRNKVGRAEPLIICSSCRTPSHPTCIDLTLAMVGKIESYGWQCMECKTCAQCNDPDDEERMIFCDMCDRGYHIYCVGLRKVPNGRWHCKVCAHCYSCGSRAPSGNEAIKNAEWQHEFRKEKADKKELKYACTLCVPCDKYWKRRQFCHVCLKVYKSIPEDHMIRCSGCPKYVHRDGGCSTQQDNERYCANCMKGRRKTALNHSRILAAAKKKMASGF